MTKRKLSEEAKQARREYMRAWQKANPEKCKNASERYWERKAEALQEEKEKQGDAV